MTRALAIGLLLILAAPLALAKSKKCTVRLHAQGNENDGSVFSHPRNNTDFREKHFH